MLRAAYDIGFSALQRAENSSILDPYEIDMHLEAFQCSSASRKFLNQNTGHRAQFHPAVSVLFSEPKIPQFTLLQRLSLKITRFSALQRAENSSI